ncbi:hypothetical protein HYX58_06400 [Candidatus Dependentiae bacterium]|nr:hypothetical protein [Candidatus Dependentiae bacterium]
MKKLLSFFIVASCLAQGLAQAAVTGYRSLDEAVQALRAAVESSNPGQAKEVLDRLGTYKNNPRLADLIQRVTKLAGEQPPFLPVNPPARGGLSQEVKNAAAAVKTAVTAVQDAGKGLSPAEKAEVGNLAGIPDLLK